MGRRRRKSPRKGGLDAPPPMKRGARAEKLAPPQSMIAELSAEEEKKAQELFNLYDYDKGGTICAAELKDLLDELNLPVSQEMVMDYLFQGKKKKGQMKDKTISFEEFKGVYKRFVATQPSAVRKQNRSERINFDDVYFTSYMLREAFKYYDADKSGKLDAMELGYIMEDIGLPDVHGDGYQSMIDEAIAIADVDGDQLIDYHEFCFYVNYVVDEIYSKNDDSKNKRVY